MLAEAVDLLSEDDEDEDDEEEDEDDEEGDDVEEVELLDVEPFDGVELLAGLLLDDEPRLSLR